MIPTTINIQQYLQQYHPDIAKEVYSRFKSIPCTPEVIQQVHHHTIPHAHEHWQVQIISIAAALLLVSPETIYTDCGIRRNSGVATILGKQIGVSKQVISKKVERARHYYTHVSWAREAVDQIVKEVRNG
ncbi:hypothetical protein M8998_07340 [Sphingobacterium sp. lm-10]|uniref:hypothetical protein n=1 Tax=Sphingobacterium sp. lm-10 TaxID=2944904 RepID=UPI0020201569|nr:hypothetical protein [Sphingobacterium sp. lm-10]MCL7987748.1 hypothetical protein [Sphingobacterium sp. lm-10]